MVPEDQATGETGNSTSSTSHNLTFLRERLSHLESRLEEEFRRREALEARNRELALHLYYVTAEQIRGVKAVRQMVENQDGMIREVRLDLEWMMRTSRLLRGEARRRRKRRHE